MGKNAAKAVELFDSGVHVSHWPVLTTLVDGCGGFAYSASYADTPTTAGEHPCGDRTDDLSDYN